MDLALVLQSIIPGIDLLAEVTIASENGVQTIRSWRCREPQPTEKQLATAWERLQASTAAIESLRAGLTAAWGATFTEGEKAFLQPLYLAALAKLDAGDIAGLKELILTAPSISAELDAKRETLAKLLPKDP